MWVCAFVCVSDIIVCVSVELEAFMVRICFCVWVFAETKKRGKVSSWAPIGLQRRGDFDSVGWVDLGGWVVTGVVGA